MRDKEKQNAYNRDYYAQHHAAMREQAHKWQEEHTEYTQTYNRDYRAKQHVAMAVQLRAKRKSRIEFVRVQKIGKQCALCGENDVTKLCFHHLDPATKLFTIGSTIHSMKATLEEIAKCDVLCKDCHKKEHARLRLLARIVH